jgi:hypothetical protein
MAIICDVVYDLGAFSSVPWFRKLDVLQCNRENIPTQLYLLDRRLGCAQNRRGREKSRTYWGWNSEPSALQPVISRYTVCVIPSP